MIKYATTLVTPLAVVATVILGPYIYNHYIFSLGRLHQSIEIGQPYVKVVETFESYYAVHSGSDEVQISKKDAELFLYHVNIFDDCQLTVRFGDAGLVKEITYIGD